MNIFSQIIFIPIKIIFMATLKKICLLTAVVLLSNYLPAQDKLNIKFGKVTPEEFWFQRIFRLTINLGSTPPP